ncbi:hypothetical protein M8998_03550 [Sphingobacterium sp. lm-10]|uniref:histidine kinase dimerization/phospho-acceptor domain-containing protein n=1 Tax=Sphingobacterium sp. lm-10 TaxID=2944904 RepID=UPI00202244BD|nr:histidine kinase dimerization/phospho-acceptor domain-containing protein [Sphingobacterium sp. lm-10]MCL7987013.1 hypothetical protein [Sphingobacterium sp. lm-10]
MKNKETQMLGLLQKSSVATVVYTSATLDIGFINDGMRAVFGRSVGDKEARFSDLLPDGEQSILGNLLTEIWNSGKPFHLHAYPIRMTVNGSLQCKYMDWNVQPIVDSEGYTEAMIHTVIETSNPMRNRNSQQTDETSSDAKLEKWSHALSHDLRNPLSVAKLGMQYMRSRIQMTPEEHTKWVNMVIDALQNLEKLITDTVEVSRNIKNNQADVNQDMDVAHWVHHITNNNRSFGLGDKKMEIGTLLPVRGDSDVLYQVFSLAIQGATQALAAKSKFTIAINSTRADREVIYTINTDNLNLEKELICYPVLEKMMQELNGKVSFHSKNGSIILNFPIF